jgi:high-affinity iron transporter
VIVVLGALAIVVPLARQASRIVDPEPVPPPYAGLARPAGAVDLALARRSFEDNCAPCHDESGSGSGPGSVGLDPPPAPLSGEGYLGMRSDAYLFWRISEGKRGTAMPSFKHALDAEERWRIVAYLRATLDR